MSEEDLELCEKFIRDPTRNPLTGVRLIKDKGPYNNYINLCKKYGLSPLTVSQQTPNTTTQARVKSPTKTRSPANKRQTSSVKISPRTQGQHLPTSNITPDMNRIFTGIPDTDLIILLNTNSLSDIVAISNTSRYFRNLLNKRSSWNRLQHHFGIFQLNNFQELAILKQELEKTKIRYKEYRGNKIYDFRSGDRVLITSKPENYVVVNVKSPNITLQEVDMFGTPSSDNLITGKLDGSKNWNKPWQWYYNEKIENIGMTSSLAISFGINNDAGFRIRTLDSPYLKYKTLPSDMQHGKPVEDSNHFTSPPNKGKDYLIKLNKIPGLMTHHGTIKVITYKEFQFIPNFKPEPGMLVEVLQQCPLWSSCLTNIYYIETMYDEKLLLKIVPELSPDHEYSNISDTFTAVKKNDTWYDTNTGRFLTLIFGSGNIHNYGPR
jgi:hypothetical protein